MDEQAALALDQVSVSMAMLRLLGTTLVLLVIVLLVRAVLSKLIRTSIRSTELRRKWLVQTRNGLILLFLLGLVMIWGEELRTLALSIVAIAVAFVVATKELIMCFMGSLVKGGARSFDIGDRIQVKDFRGDVIDQNLLATTILEVGPGKLTHQRTGRATVIPNSLFVSEPVINESFTEDYVLHVFTVPFKREDDWQKAQKVLLEVAQAQCQPYLESARKYMRRLGDRSGLEVPMVDPRVSLQVPVAGEMHLVVRYPCRPAQRSAIEQAILLEAFGRHNFSVESNGVDESGKRAEG